jgi:hypothetical protein
MYTRAMMSALPRRIRSRIGCSPDLDSTATSQPDDRIASTAS